MGRRPGGWGSRGRRQLEIRGARSSKEAEVSQHTSRKIKIFIVQLEANLQCRLLFDGSFHP
jgi:hypothetical protein